MSKLVLYIAASLDGYIARSDHGLDWLLKFDNSQTDYGYSEFYSSVDAVLMGRKTYEVALSLGPWAYRDKPNFVMSRSTDKFEHAEKVSGEIGPVVTELKSRFKCIWLVGGAELLSQSLSARCLDEIIITVIPVILGSGIRLFDSPIEETELIQTEVRSYSRGLAQIKYSIIYNS